MGFRKYIRKYIDEDVILISEDDFERKKIEGRLKKIIPSIEAEDSDDTLIIDCNESEKRVPANSILQFLPRKELLDENTLYYYVIFRYGKTERSKEHIYMSYDHSIKPGDKVLVWKDWLYVGNVIKTGFFTRETAPYPIEKTWMIQEKVYDRIDFCKYPDSFEIIKDDNLYQNKYLNSANDYKQYMARIDYQYQWLAQGNTDFLESRKPETSDAEQMTRYAIAQTEYELDWDWCESNQIDVFYRTLWICSYIARYNGYDKFYFDKYLCLSLIYKHGDFDQFMLLSEIDKINIQRDVCFLDDYILSKFFS